MEGRKEGLMEGRTEGRAEVAKNLLNDGLSIEKVAQYTKLPREEIEALLQCFA
jgi:predicted transposase/invertase (TIGR01784 family)